MNKNPLRVLILLPLVLAMLVGAQVYTAPAGIAAAASSTMIVAPTVVDHSSGPSPAPGIIVTDSFFDIFVDVANVGPRDIDGYNVAGQLDIHMFSIIAVRDGGVGNAECDAMGGSQLFQTAVNLHTGEWAASKLCTAGLPAPEPGFTGSGHLVRIIVKVRAIGCSAIPLVTRESFLRDLDGFDSVPVPADVVNGNYCNTPEFSSDFSGHASGVSPRTLGLGNSVKLHSNVQSTGATSALVVYSILKPNGKTDVVKSGPTALIPNTGTNMPDATYTPGATGDYSVSATLYWSEDGGVNFLYKGSTETRNFDFRVTP